MALSESDSIKSLTIKSLFYKLMSESLRHLYRIGGHTENVSSEKIGAFAPLGVVDEVSLERMDALSSVPGGMVIYHLARI